jgi:hypothetical protein
MVRCTVIHREMRGVRESAILDGGNNLCRDWPTTKGIKMSQKNTKWDCDEAAVHLQGEFRKIAYRMRPRDPQTQEDLVQEMCTAVVEIKEPNTLGFFRERAKCRAKNALRNWFRSSPVDRVLHQTRRQREGRFDVFDEPQKQEKFLQSLARDMERNVPSAEDLIEWVKRSA